MKSNLIMLLLVLLIATSPITINAQDNTADSTGLPGDNFSLQGALEMFQKAGSPEEFEKLLNAEDNHVNNLDLNEDGDIDYIRVIDNGENNAHAFVLQDIVSETESQDIAVIELEKTGDTTAVLQIIGDEDIYGEETIVEPGEGGDDDAAFNNSNYNLGYGPYPYAYFNNPRIIVNVWLWPSVRFIYTPDYTVWHSPWRWRHYPVYWHPWHPFAWHVWHPFHRGYYAHFGITHTHRVLAAHRIYTPFRTTSAIVRTHHAAALGNYRATRTRTIGPRGNVRTRTTVTGPRGNTRTRTTVRRH